MHFREYSSYQTFIALVSKTELIIHSGAPNQAGGPFAPVQQTKPSIGSFGSSLGTSQPQQNNTQVGALAPSTSRGLFAQGANNQQQAAGSFLSGLSTQPAGNQFPPQPSQLQQTSLLGVGLGQPSLQQPTGAGLLRTQQAQPQQSGGLFQSLGQKQIQNPSQPPQGGLLGSFGQNKAPSMLSVPLSQSCMDDVLMNPTNTLCSPNTANQQQQAFTQQPASIFAASIGQYSQQHQTIPGVRISVNELRPTTRFNDLHEELQKQIEEIDNFILSQMRYQGECQELMREVDVKSSAIPDDVEYCAKTLETLQTALENDAEAIAVAKTSMTTDSANAKLSFDVIRALKMPQQFHHFALWSGQASSHAGEGSLIRENEVAPNKNLVSYFSQAADQMFQHLSKYKDNIDEVETYLRGLEVNLSQQVQQLAFVRGRDGGAKRTDDQTRELAAVLREFEIGILGVAGKVGSTREKVQELALDDFGELGSSGRLRKY